MSELAGVTSDGGEPADTERRFGPVLRKVSAPVLGVLLVWGVWQLLTRGDIVDGALLPGPGAVLTALIDLTRDGLIWPNLRITLIETVSGFAIGSSAAFTVAVLATLSTYLRGMVYPMMVALQVTPRIALAPLVIAWFGFGVSSKIALAALVCFFPVFINTVTGLTSVDRDALEMFRSMRASNRQIFWQLRLPGALPVAFAGLKTAMTLALIGAVAAEFLAGSQGLGLLMAQFSTQLALADAFAILVWLTVIGLVLFVVMELLDRAIVFWTHDNRMLARTQRLDSGGRWAVPLLPTRGGESR